MTDQDKEASAISAVVKGKFKRSSVRIIYVHLQSSFHFLWRPFKPK